MIDERAEREQPGSSELITFFVLALAARLALAWHEGMTSWNDDDNAIYLDVGASFAEGAPLSIRWPPLLPLIHAALSHVSDDGIVAARLVSILVSAATVPLVMAIASGWAGRSAGRIAGLLAACDGYLIRSAVDTMTEPHYAFWTLAFLALMTRARLADAGFLRLAGAGCCLGLACLARPTGLAAAVIALACLGGLAVLRREGGSLRAMGGMVVVVTAMSAFVAPWAARNLAQTGHLLLTTTGSGSTLLGSNCRKAFEREEAWLPAGECEVLTPAEQAAHAALMDVDLVAADRMLREIAWEEVRRNRDIWPKQALRKAAAFWGWGHLGMRGSPLARVSLLSLTALLPFALLGVAWMLRRGVRKMPETAVVALAWIAFAQFLSLVFWGGHRMRAPVEPLVLCLAAVGLVVTWQRLRTRGDGAAPRETHRQ